MNRNTLALLLAFALGALAATVAGAHADTPAAFDHDMAGRIVRALERSADANHDAAAALHEVARSAEHCAR